jgi:hypothetical protein
MSRVEKELAIVIAPRSLHLMGSAFAIEKVPRFSGAFTLTPLWLFATADVGADLIAAGNPLFGSSERFCLSFGHFHVSLGSVRVNTGSNVTVILVSAE